MSTHAPKQVPNQLPRDVKIGIVAARFNAHIVDELLKGCLKRLKELQLRDKKITVKHVPGAFELPLAAKMLAKTKKFEAVICLGCVIRGDTPHFDYVAGECARGIQRVSLDETLPVIFGVLTTNTEKQATDRIDAGERAADAAAEMILLAQGTAIVSWTDRAILAGLMAVIALSRLHTYHEPLDWDIATYSIIGHEISHGQSLYSDAWDIKPPAIFVTYAGAELITGQGFGQVYFLGVGAACVTLLAIYQAGFAMGRFAAIFAAVAFTILSGDMGLDANRPNTEVFINACLAWGFALLVNWNEKHTWRRAIVVGLVLGLATLYKQVAIIPAALLIASHARRSALVILATIVLMWALVFAYFSATDRAWLFWVTTFQSPRAYGGSIIDNLDAAFYRVNLIARFLITLLPPAILSLFILVEFKKVSLSRLGLLIALMIGTFLAIAIPGQFFQHYYQLWLVPLTIGAGWGISLLTKSPLLQSRWIGCAITAVVIFGMIWWQVPSYRHPSIDWALANYGSNFVDDQRFGQELASLLGSNDTFYDWSNSPWLYCVMHRRPPAAGIWRSHTVEGPLAEWLSERTLENLRSSPPRFVTIWGPDGRLPDHPIDQWIHQNYAAVPDPERKRRQFILMERKRHERTN